MFEPSYLYVIPQAQKQKEGSEDFGDPGEGSVMETKEVINFNKKRDNQMQQKWSMW